MEFQFNLNDYFKSPIVEIGSNLVPADFSGSRRDLWNTVNKVTEIINDIGEASANAQGLSKPITTAHRLRQFDQMLFLLVDRDANNGNGVVAGMLKFGRKGLNVFDRIGQFYRVIAPCVLDFYIHEKYQRQGFGKQLFDYMMKREKLLPHNLAMDGWNQKFLNFLKKHYNLENPIKQTNNYIVFDDFFPDSQNRNQMRIMMRTDGLQTAKPEVVILQEQTEKATKQTTEDTQQQQQDVTSTRHISAQRDENIIMAANQNQLYQQQMRGYQMYPPMGNVWPTYQQTYPLPIQPGALYNQYSNYPVPTQMAPTTYPQLAQTAPHMLPPQMAPVSYPSQDYRSQLYYSQPPYYQQYPSMPTQQPAPPAAVTEPPKPPTEPLQPAPPVDIRRTEKTEEETTKQKDTVASLLRVDNKYFRMEPLPFEKPQHAGGDYQQQRVITTKPQESVDALLKAEHEVFENGVLRDEYRQAPQRRGARDIAPVIQDNIRTRQYVPQEFLPQTKFVKIDPPPKYIPRETLIPHFPRPDQSSGFISTIRQQQQTPQERTEGLLRNTFSQMTYNKRPEQMEASTRTLESSKMGSTKMSYADEHTKTKTKIHDDKEKSVLVKDALAHSEGAAKSLSNRQAARNLKTIQPDERQYDEVVIQRRTYKSPMVKPQQTDAVVDSLDMKKRRSRNVHTVKGKWNRK